MIDGDDDRPVHLVLDTSAVVGFIRGVHAVGELIAEIDDEGGAVGIPLPCLVEAAANTIDSGPLLIILAGHRATVVVGEDPIEWGMLAGVRARLGAYEPAAAAWLALKYDVDVMTRYPRQYEALGGGGITLPFDD